MQLKDCKSCQQLPLAVFNDLREKRNENASFPLLVLVLASAYVQLALLNANMTSFGFHFLHFSGKYNKKLCQQC